MRILQLPEFYPPVVGGMELHARRLARALADRGHHVSVCTLAGPDGPGTDEVDGLTVHRIDGWRRHLSRFAERPEAVFHPTLPDPGVRRALRAVLEIERPDVVHAHGWILYSALCEVPRTGAALVATMHDFGLACPKRTMLRPDGRLCDGPAPAACLRCAPEQYGRAKGTLVTLGHAGSTRALHGRADAYIAVSSAVRDAVLAAGASRGARVEVVPNMFDPAPVEASREAPRPAWVPHSGPYVLFVGALTGFKGVHDLVEVWRRHRPAADLVLAGSPRPDMPTDLPERVRLVSNVPNDEVLAAMRHAVASVTPSVGPDACPTTVLEAMACGVPVVASRIGGIPDLVEHEVHGLLVTPGDVDGLAAALARVMSDRRSAGRMAAAALDRSADFTTAAVGARIEDLYTRLRPGIHTPADIRPAPPSVLPGSGQPPSAAQSAVLSRTNSRSGST